MQKNNTTLSRVLYTLDHLPPDTDFKDLLQLFKLHNVEVNKKVLNCYVIIISTIDAKTKVFKKKFEPVFVSLRFLKALSKNVLCKTLILHPDILVAKVLVLISNICIKSDKLTLPTMEVSHCLQDMLNIFIQYNKVFKGTVNWLQWTIKEQNIFQLIWDSLAFLFVAVITNKTNVLDEISPTCEAIFIQALKFCKLYISGDLIINGWSNTKHIGIFDYVNNSIQYDQYFNLFHKLGGIKLMISWLKGSDIDLPQNTCFYSGYIFKILYKCVIRYPDEMLKENIISKLFSYLSRNCEYACKDLYLGEKYCCIGDICEMIQYLINYTKTCCVTFRFDLCVNFLERVVSRCEDDCLSRVQCHKLIFTIKDIYRSPIAEVAEIPLNELIYLLDLTLKQLKILDDIKNSTESFIKLSRVYSESSEDEHDTQSNKSRTDHQHGFEMEGVKDGYVEMFEENVEGLDENNNSDLDSYPSPEFSSNTSSHRRDKNENDDEEMFKIENFNTGYMEID